MSRVAPLAQPCKAHSRPRQIFSDWRGGHPRDHCVLTLFLQLGLRVSELVNFHVADVDLTERLLIVRNGKGGKDRAIPLEKRSYTALKTYLAYRADSLCPELFLSYQGQGMSDRAVKKLVEKYRRRAGIEKTTRVAKCSEDGPNSC
jgi:site-specific recombinase XerD